MTISKSMPDFGRIGSKDLVSQDGVGNFSNSCEKCEYIDIWTSSHHRLH